MLYTLRALSLTLFICALSAPVFASPSDRLAGGHKKPKQLILKATSNMAELSENLPVELAEFYASRDWQPLWINSTSKTKEIISVLENAWTHGLPAGLYNIDSIKQLEKNRTVKNLIKLEISLTQALAQMAQDLSGPFLNPSIIKSDSKYWPKPLKNKEIISLINEKQSATKVIQAVTPQDPLYVELSAYLKASGPELNLKDFKVQQAVSNMERLRWLPREKPKKYIFVNIAAANLWAIDNDKVKLDMPVVVGKRWRPTYSFMTQVTGVRFNPRWTVPITIKRFDFLPKLKQDPFALADKNIELYDGFGSNAMTLAADAIDWQNLSKKGLQKIVFRQGPGDDNPLGRYRLLMPNKYNVFLHDTNHPQFFERETRNLSSGCVRVKHPEKLAAFVLGDESTDYSHYLDTNEETDVSAHRIPVILAYLSASLDTDGKLSFNRDSYRYDTKMAKALFKNHPDFVDEELASLAK